MSPVAFAALAYLAIGALFVILVIAVKVLVGVTTKLAIQVAEKNNELDDFVREELEAHPEYGQARVREMVEKVRNASYLETIKIVGRYNLRQIEEEKIPISYRFNLHAWSTSSLFLINIFIILLSWPFVLYGFFGISKDNE